MMSDGPHEMTADGSRTRRGFVNLPMTNVTGLCLPLKVVHEAGNLPHIDFCSGIISYIIGSRRDILWQT